MKSRKAIICVILFWGVQHFSCKTSIKDELKNKQFKGLIVKKSNSDIGCFGSFVITDGQKSEVIENICYCVSESQDVWGYAMVGDSIFKRKGELNIYVHRENRIRKYAYPICIR